MAETFTALATGVTYGNLKSMLGLFNGGAATKVLRVYRMWQLNNNTAAVIGVMATMQVQFSSAQSSGTTITPVKHDSTNANLEAAVLCAHGATVTDSALLRQYLFSNDEAAASGATMDEWELLVPLNCVWDAGYGDSNVQPLTLRAGQGVHIKCATNTVVASADLFMEFTQAAS